MLNPLAAQMLLSRLVEPGDTFTRASLGAAMRASGREEFDVGELIQDAIDHGLVDNVGSGTYQFAGGAAMNPYNWDEDIPQVIDAEDLGPEQFAIDGETTNAELARLASEIKRDAMAEGVKIEGSLLKHLKRLRDRMRPAENPMWENYEVAYRAGGFRGKPVVLGFVYGPDMTPSQAKREAARQFEVPLASVLVRRPLAGEKAFK